MNAMNITQRHKLMDQGFTWEEAEELLDARADQQLQEERDRQLQQEYEQAEHARRLEDWNE